ncbi:hypothetical protein ABT332_03515 [Saccharomonospora azurea]|uniref:hypothetical protein n=1 Tax=Saccharomonospora azurea TaxID=40988 RepID=UPI003326E31D
MQFRLPKSQNDKIDCKLNDWWHPLLIGHAAKISSCQTDRKRIWLKQPVWVNTAEKVHHFENPVSSIRNLEREALIRREETARPFAPGEEYGTFVALLETVRAVCGALREVSS